MGDLQKLLQKMTLKEKVGQLNQRLYGWQVYEKKDGKLFLTDYFKNEVKKYGTVGVIYGVFRADPWSERNELTGLTTSEAQEVSQMIQQYMKKETRLKIPVLLSEECPHGHQALEATTLPTNFSVGCSWNPELYQQLQEVVAAELQEKGAHLGLISTLDLLRDPRWGRTEECFSEDPYLTAAFTQAAVTGLQKEQKIKAVLKHLAGQGNVMGGHNSGPVAIGERELREIHLPAIRAGIKAGAKGCMAAYNDIDGVFCHTNPHLLQEILREEYGFSGIVMADGCALDRVAETCSDPSMAAAKAISSGVDLSLWDEVFPYLEQAVAIGLVSEEVIDRSVLRILELKSELGLFSSQSSPKVSFTSAQKETLCTALAEDSLVLLKNDNILPLKKEKLNQIGVVGPHANNIYHLLGDYTPFKKIASCCNLLQGIEEHTANSTTQLAFAQGCQITTDLPQGLDEANQVAENADVIVVTLGGSSARDFSTAFAKNGAALQGSQEMTSGENIDLASIELPECQIKLVKELAKHGKPVIAVLIEGRPHSISAIELYVSAILFAGYPGQYGGKAIANVLFGKNPNGRLAFTIPEHSGQLPVYYNYRNTQFKETYTDYPEKPIYRFGYGLSYTSFELTDVLFTDHQDHSIKVSCRLKNTGNHSGAETIQIYGKKQQGFIPPREKELLAFKKVHLTPLEERMIEIILTKEQLYYLDETFKEVLPREVHLTVETVTFKQSIQLFRKVDDHEKSTWCIRS